jgi:hypothetical protein
MNAKLVNFTDQLTINLGDHSNSKCIKTWAYFVYRIVQKLYNFTRQLKTNFSCFAGQKLSYLTCQIVQKLYNCSLTKCPRFRQTGKLPQTTFEAGQGLKGNCSLTRQTTRQTALSPIGIRQEGKIVVWGGSYIYNIYRGEPLKELTQYILNICRTDEENFSSADSSKKYSEAGPSKKISAFNFEVEVEAENKFLCSRISYGLALKIESKHWSHEALSVLEVRYLFFYSCHFQSLKPPRSKSHSPITHQQDFSLPEIPVTLSPEYRHATAMQALRHSSLLDGFYINQKRSLEHFSN